MPEEKTFMELVDAMDSVSQQIADAWGVEAGPNVLSKNLPKEKEFINFDTAYRMTGITKVAYCSNLLCFCLFVGNEKVYCVRQCSIKTTKGLMGFFKFGDMKAKRPM